jgi:hypothetical protein
MSQLLGPTDPDDEDLPPRGFLADLISGDEEFDDDTKPSDPPIHWPSLTPPEAAAEWQALYGWVVTLQHRFRGMVRLPPCWYRHNDLVEALSALRDHERISYSDAAAPTAAVTWHTAFRDIETRLRTWITELRCGGDPDYHDRTVHTPTAPDLTPPPDLLAWIGEDFRARESGAAHPAVLDGPRPLTNQPRSQQ